MPRGPVTFTISKNKNIYVPDFANHRINIYDLHLNYKYFIIEKEHGIMQYGNIHIDDNMNLIANSTSLGLKKINQTGETVFLLSKQNLPKNFDFYNYFLINNNIIYYDDTGSIKTITSDGNIRDSVETLNIVREIEKNEIENTKEEQKSLATKRNILIDIQNKEKSIIIGDKYYTSRFSDMKDYFEKAKKYYAFKKELKNEIKSENININEKSFEICKFIGFDAEHNSYWKSYAPKQEKWEEFIFVYSNYGEVIDAFYFSDLKDKNIIWGDLIKIAVAPSGDVYFMRNDETGSYFWKIERRW
jgi:hypothetical protein